MKMGCMSQVLLKILGENLKGIGAELTRGEEEDEEEKVKIEKEKGASAQLYER